MKTWKCSCGEEWPDKYDKCPPPNGCGGLRTWTEIASPSNPPSTTGSREKALPEKVWIALGGGGYWIMRVKEPGDDPKEAWTKYVPESALSQARASAFEEAASAMEKNGWYSGATLVRNLAARSSAGAEEGEKR